MAKAIDVVNRALRLIGVASEGEALEASTAADALDVLNGLLAEWYGNIAIPDYSAASLVDDLTIDAGDKEALSYQLALRLAPEYGQALSAEFVQAADASMTRLRNRYFVAGRTNFDELPNPVSVWEDC